MDNILSVHELKRIQRVAGERQAFDLVPIINEMLKKIAEDVSLDLSEFEIFLPQKVYFPVQEQLARIFARSGWHVHEFKDVVEEDRPGATSFTISWKGDPA